MFSDFYPDIKTGITRRNMWDLVRHHKTQTVINNVCNMISHHHTLLNFTYWGLLAYQHERLSSVMCYNDKSEIHCLFLKGSQLAITVRGLNVTLTGGWWKMWSPLSCNCLKWWRHDGLVELNRPSRASSIYCGLLNTMEPITSVVGITL